MKPKPTPLWFEHTFLGRWRYRYRQIRIYPHVTRWSAILYVWETLDLPWRKWR